MQALQEKMKNDPEFAKQMQERAAAMQAQMAPQMQAMQSFMSNPEVKERMKALESDPDMAEYFEAMRNEGPAAMAKYMNDETILRKFAQAMEGLTPPQLDNAVGSGTAGGAAAAAAPPAQAPPEAPEVTNLIEAARYGDLEAVEDFLAIGKDVNERDADERTPLHYAVAFGSGEVGMSIVREILEAEPDLEARDAKQNTPLHYCAGYGRVEFAKALLEAGADAGARNEEFKSALDLAQMNEKNPINADADLIASLTPP